MVKEIGAACAGVAIGSTHVKVLMYADGVVIISDNAKDLQNGFDAAERFADQLSFEVSLDTGKSEVIVFGDDRDYPYEWKLMGETMKQVEEYAYLGLTMHRSLGRHLGAARS